jgi:hypothetical protein
MNGRAVELRRIVKKSVTLVGEIRGAWKASEARSFRARFKVASFARADRSFPRSGEGEMRVERSSHSLELPLRTDALPRRRHRD